jgi:pilus assembly protein Flp/PilA
VDQEMLNAVTWFVDDEEGAAAIEYGLIGALVSVAGLAALGLAGDALDQMLTQVANVMMPPSP